MVEKLSTEEIIKIHQAQFEKDKEIHGCGYWSVCSDHCCPCSPEAPVSQGFSEKTWQSLAKDLAESINE